MVKLLKIIALSCGAICLLLSAFFYLDEDGVLWWGNTLILTVIFLVIASCIKKIPPQAATAQPSETSETDLTQKGMRDIFGDEIVRKKKNNNYKKYILFFSTLSVVLILGVYPRLESKSWQEWLTYINLLALAITWLVYGSSKRE